MTCSRQPSSTLSAEGAHRHPAGSLPVDVGPGSSPHSSLGSSEPSPQSSSPSHFQRAGMQRPESLQRNSSTPQVIWAAGGRGRVVVRGGDSQECAEGGNGHWGAQGLRDWAARWEGGSVGGAPGLGGSVGGRLGGRGAPGSRVPGYSLQLAGSSLPSTQSLSRSHTQTRGMQRLVMEHWNWLGAQVTSAVGGTE